MPAFLPWFAILGLLTFKHNRTAAAWTIAIPLVLIPFATSGLAAVLPMDVPSEFQPMLQNAFTSLAFGIAALWLWSPQLQHRFRSITFLKMLAACAAVGGFAWLVRNQGNYAAGITILAVSVLSSVAALSLAGVWARRRYRPVLLLVSMVILVTALFTTIALPFYLAGSGGNVDWGEFFEPVLSVAGLCLAALLPFVLLAFLCPFYRDRLRNLIHMGAPAEANDGATTFTPAALPQPIERTLI